MAYESERREAQKRETRRALVEAATALFLEHGVDGPSLDAICEAAGYTRGAFYLHFKDREGLVLAAMEALIGGFVAELTGSGLDAGDPRASLEVLARALDEERAVVSGSKKLQFRHVLQACARYPRVRERYLSLLELGEGSLRALLERAAVPDAAARARVLVATVLGLLASVELGRAVPGAEVRAALEPLLLPRARERATAAAKKTQATKKKATGR